MNSRISVKTTEGHVLLDMDAYALVLELMLGSDLVLNAEFKVFVDGVEQAPPPEEEDDDEDDE